jgi:hypothetical protein
MACVLGESHVTRGTADSADDWSIWTTHEQGNLYSESLFLSCRWLWCSACDVHSLFVATFPDVLKNKNLSSCVQSRWCLYRQTIYRKKDGSVAQQLKHGPDWVRTLLGDNNTRLQSIEAVKKEITKQIEKILQPCTTSIHLPCLDKKNNLIQCNET